MAGGGGVAGGRAGTGKVPWSCEQQRIPAAQSLEHSGTCPGAQSRDCLFSEWGMWGRKPSGDTMLARQVSDFCRTSWLKLLTPDDSDIVASVFCLFLRLSTCNKHGWALFV